MRVTNLMVEDWVEVIQNSKKRFAQVQMIDGYGDNATSNECLCDAIYYSIDELNPIPLTTEILENNGFKEFYGYGYAGNKGYIFKDFYINNDFTIKTANIKCKINYVHELQHALKLCGIEKDIEL